MTASLHSLTHARRRLRENVASLKLYRPRPHQAVLHRSRTRFSVWVCHRRFGKTVACINEAIRELVLLGVAQRDRPRAGYLAPFYRQAKRVAWDYARHYSKPILDAHGGRVLESELSILYPWGARLSLYGADNPDSLRGEYFDFVVLDEVAQMAPRTWTEVIRPALADRKGAAIFIGTPWGRNNLFHRLYEHAADAKDWSRQLLTVDDTDAISDEELSALRREMSESEFRQEMLCDWNAAVPGAYYARYIDEAEREGRIGDVTYDRNLPVLTAWDFGIADPTVVVYIQIAGAEVRFLGADAIADLSLPEIVAQVKATRPYSFSRNFIPHDGARRAGEIVGAPTRADIMADHGLPAEIVRTPSLDEGIEAVRRMFSRARFDARGCRDLLEALRLYRAEYDDQRRVHRLKPVHDWTSHYADAVRTFAQATDGRDEDLWAQEDLDLLDNELERRAI